MSRDAETARSGAFRRHDEFGHALDVGHTPDEYWGVMSGGAALGTNRNRDLYLSDIERANVIAGTRRLRPYHRYHVGGTLRGESTFLPAHPSTPQAAVGVARNTDGAWSWAAAFRIGSFGCANKGPTVRAEDTSTERGAPAAERGRTA